MIRVVLSLLVLLACTGFVHLAAEGDRGAASPTALNGSAWDVVITAAGGVEVKDRWSFTANDLITGTLGTLPNQVAGTRQRTDVTATATLASGDTVVVRGVITSSREIAGFIERKPRTGASQRLEFKGLTSGAVPQKKGGG